MTARSEYAAKVVGRALAAVPPAGREQLLREIMAHAAAGISVISGPKEAAETTYRLADAVATRTKP